ncbi:MAG: ABC transporter permease subunit [Planctomycetota bacterium]
MPVQLLAIARNTFIEAIRQPVFFVILLLSGLLQILNTWGTNFSMEYTDSAGMTGDDKLLLDVGLATVFVCGMLLAAFVATAVLSREIENKTVLTVVSKPISRTAVVLGKFLGVAVAITIAVMIMLSMLLLAVRHGVLSNATDTVDQPVLLAAALAVGLSMVIGAWCNFYYGWHFAQTATLVLLPTILFGWGATTFVNPDWQIQHPLDDIRAEVLIACYCLLLAILVLTAAATAASTRLGQVMTIVVCAGVFVFGLLANHFVGRHAFQNQPVGLIATAEPTIVGDQRFEDRGDRYRITLLAPPADDVIRIGTSFYYGPNPNGSGMLAPAFEPFIGEAEDELPLSSTGEPGRIAVVEMASDNGQEFFVEIVGTTRIEPTRPPQQDDYFFTEPTRTNPIALGLWGVVPNMQAFWLLDAVSQNRVVPTAHVGLVSGYAAMQIGALLALGVILFQKRDVG